MVGLDFAVMEQSPSCLIIGFYTASSRAGAEQRKRLVAGWFRIEECWFDPGSWRMREWPKLSVYPIFLKKDRSRNVMQRREPINVRQLP